MSDTVVRERQPVLEASAAQGRVRWWVPVVVFLAVAVVVWLVAGVAAAHLPRTEQYSPAPEHVVGGSLFEPWVRWDAFWYRSIVVDGYTYFPGVQSSVAFWPSYPIVLRLLDPLSPSPFVTGTLVTVTSGLGAAFLFHRWCGRWLDPRAAMASLLLLLLFPFAWYLYGPVYADAFCLMAILASFLALERDRLWLAGLLGLVASAARPIGIVFAVALVLRVIERRNEVAVDRMATRRSTQPEPVTPGGANTPQRPLGLRPAGRAIAHGQRWGQEVRARFSPFALSWSDARVLLAFAGVIAWCGYLWVVFGDPLLWQHIQSVPGWDQGSGPSTWFKVFLVEQILHDASSPFTWSKAAQGAVAVGVLALTSRIARRFGWAYAAFTAGVVLVPVVGTKDFMGAGRYLLVAFPAFAVAGAWLVDRPRLRTTTLIASGLLLAFLTTLYARGHYLA